MLALDTNVVVRLLVADDAAQVARARRRVEDALRDGTSLLIPLIVIVEVAWVLRRSYKVPKADVLMALRRLVETPPMQVQDAPTVIEAMERWAEGSGDFSDYLIRASARECSAVLTFDEAVLGEPGFEAP